MELCPHVTQIILAKALSTFFSCLRFRHFASRLYCRLSLCSVLCYSAGNPSKWLVQSSEQKTRLPVSTNLELRLQPKNPTSRVMAEPTAHSAVSQTQFPEAYSASPQRKAAPSFPFKYYIHDSVSNCRLQLFGDFREVDVPDLRGCWNTVRTTLVNRKLVMDVCGLRSADDSARRWLIEMAAEGATFLPENYFSGGTPCQELDSASTRPGIFARLLSVFRGSRPVQA